MAERPYLHVNPVIAGLAGEHTDPPAVVRCRGYVGHSGRPGRVRLYLTLSDLSQYIEFDEDAIVHVMEAPERILPGGGVFIWLKATSQVRAVRARILEARALAAVIARTRYVKRWRWRRAQILRQRQLLRQRAKSRRRP